MQSTKELLPLLREGKLELHCINIKIWQEDGVELFGHGVIKINKHGVLYLEFICTQNNNIPSVMFSEKLPKDSLDEKEKFYLECETISGDTLKTSGFSVEFSLSDRQPPKKKILFSVTYSAKKLKKDMITFSTSSFPNTVIFLQINPTVKHLR